MGSAFTGLADDASSLFSNPAGLATLRRSQITLCSDLGWAGNFEETAVVSLPLGMGGLGFAGSYLSYGTLEGRDEAGSLAPNYGADRMVFQAGGGWKLAPGLFLGASLRGLREKLEEKTYSFLVPDLGAMVEPLKGLKIGLDYAHGGWGDAGIQLVSTLRSGLSWEDSLDSSSRFLITVGNCLELNSLDYLQAGAEFSFRSTYFLRAGYQSGLTSGGFAGLSFGAGVDLGGFLLDYAYLPHGELGDTHRFSLGYTLDSAPGPSSNKVPGGSDQNSGKETGARTMANRNGKGNDRSSDFSGENSTKTSSSLTGKGLPSGHPPPTEAGSGIPTADNASFRNDSSSDEKTGGSSLPPLLTAEKKSGNTPQPVKPDAPKDSLNLSFNIPPDFTAQGEAQEEQGHHVEALKLFQQAIQKDPRNATAWWDMGRVYQKAGQKAYAVHCYEKALELRPGDKAFQNWLDKYKAP